MSRGLPFGFRHQSRLSFSELADLCAQVSVAPKGGGGRPLVAVEVGALRRPKAEEVCVVARQAQLVALLVRVGVRVRVRVRVSLVWG
eukprot:scaffold1493_cov66-Phaeocystis_antarctica.AAC.2